MLLLKQCVQLQPQSDVGIAGTAAVSVSLHPFRRSCTEAVVTAQLATSVAGVLVGEVVLASELAGEGVFAAGVLAGAGVAAVFFLLRTFHPPPSSSRNRLPSEMSSPPR